MTEILTISGKVKFKITLDPGVWIFDDRKVELDKYFSKQKEVVEEENMEDYTENFSKNWEREIREGAISPPTLKSERTFLKEKSITGTYGIPFEPFLNNAEVEDDAQYLMIETKEKEYKLPLSEGKKLVLGFSKDGKPLREDGPVHCYFGDGSNFNNPIKNVTGFRVE